MPIRQRPIPQGTTPQRLMRVGILLAIGTALPVGAQPADARTQLVRYLDSIAHTRLEERKKAIAQIATRADADRRKALVRQKILGLIGGLPEKQGAVTAKQLGEIAGDGFRVEKIAYESLPGFWVTANVYVPLGAGPFPAVVIAPGHGPAGKVEDWSWGGNFARNGIVALAYDPLGQGERLQYFDPDKKVSRVGNPTGEHGEANVAPMLLGEDLARYMVNDAMRGVDYLIGRKDIDGGRIGAFGCSGGGTATAYFAGLDDRVKVAASACYITSFQELLHSPTGVQDAEQSIPHFIEQGLDFPDWVELVAPKPYAIISTTNDMFPLEGARQTYEEVKRIYAIYGVDDHLQWITGPGGHGNLGPISPAILGFFTKFLKGTTAGQEFKPMRLERREDLQCTPTGQVSSSFRGETIYSIERKRAEALMTPHKALTGKGDLDKLQTRLHQDIKTLAAVSVQPGAAPPVVDIKMTESRGSYRVETIEMHSDADTVVSGLVAIPEGAGAHAAVLILAAQPKEKLAAIGGDVDRLAKAGRIVMVLEPRPTPAGTESIKSPYLGAYNLLSLRAFLVGKTIIGLRIDDTIRALDWLCARKDVNKSAITGYGDGPLGMVLLHAAALDSRIGRIVVENTLADYRMIVDQPLHRNVSEVVIPGVLRKYDAGDLLLAVYPRQVTVLNPQDALGGALTEAEFRSNLGYVFQSGQNMKSAYPIRVLSRNPGDPLPLD